MDIIPKFFILTLVYAPPGNQSSAGFTDTASIGVTATIAETFAIGTSLTLTASDPTGTGFILHNTSAGATFGITKAIGLSQSLSDTVSSSQGAQVPSVFDFVNHYQDRFFLWLNPAFTVTQTGTTSGTFTVQTPLGPNGQPEPMDILEFSIADLLNPSQIPLAKLQPRLVDGATLPGLSNICAHPLPPDQCTVTNACGCTASDFATIVKQDPLVFPIIGSSGQLVSADAPPSSVDASRFIRVNQADPFLDGGSGVKNTFTLNDSQTVSTTASESLTFSEAATFSKKFGATGDSFNLEVRNQNTVTFTDTVSLGVSASVSHTATVTLGSMTSGCDENTDVWEDVRYHTFVLVPAGPSPAPCQTQDGDFLFSASPSIQSVPVGGVTSFGVYTLGMFGFTGDESLSVTGVPPGATSTFVGSSIHGTGASELRIQTSNATPAIDYSLRVTGSSQGLTRNTNLILRVTDFSVAASPASQTITTNGTATYAIAITALTQFDSDVTLSVAGLPSGATAAFSTCNANPCTITGLAAGSANSTLTISTSSNTSPGNYAPTITATGQGITHPTSIGLNVVDFSLSVAPGSQTILAGGTATYNAFTAALNGFSGSIALSVAGLPSGTTASFSPSSLNGSSSSSLSVVTSSSTPGGNYQLTITGASGTDMHSVTVILAVQNFTLSATPSSQSVSAGGCASYTVTVVAQNGFSGPVTISLSGLPSSASASFNPSSINGSGSSTLTVCTSNATSAGVYMLTITGSSGNLTQTTTVNIVVGIDFQVSIAPTSQTVTVGGSTSYTVTITPVNGFSGVVSLSVSNLPAGAVGSFSPSTVSGSGSSTLTISTASSTPSGNYPLITITGGSGTLSHIANVTLNVIPPPPGEFSVSASQTSLTVRQGASVVDTITITSQNGFSGNVNLSVSGAPDFGSASFSPAAVPVTTTQSGNSALGIFTSTDTPTGIYTLTITGTAASGLPSHSLTIRLSVVLPRPCRTISCTPLQ
jgi:VCBS repeat-containing protein